MNRDAPAFGLALKLLDSLAQDPVVGADMIAKVPAVLTLARVAANADVAEEKTAGAALLRLAVPDAWVPKSPLALSARVPSAEKLGRGHAGG